MDENSILKSSAFSLSLTESAEALRLGTDALLLSAYIKKQTKDTAAELGAGSGAISLMLARRSCFKKIYAFEIQDELFHLLEGNVTDNCFDKIIEPVNADIRKINPEHYQKVSVIFSNPPYMKTDSGKSSPHLQKQASRHEVFGGVTEFCSVAAKILKTGGRLYLVYRPDRLETMMYALKSYGFAPKRMTFVHSDIEHSPSCVLCEAVLGGGEQLKITKPLILYSNENQTEDCKYIYKNGIFPDEFFI